MPYFNPKTGRWKKVSVRAGGRRHQKIIRAKKRGRQYNRINRQAKNQALNLKMTKIKEINNTAGNALWTNSANWMVFQPLNLDQVSTDSETDRESRLIHALNYRLTMNIEPHPESMNPFYLRFVMGYAKGSNNYGEADYLKIPSQMVQSSNLVQVVPNHFSDFDRDDWKILSDRKVRVTPKQIYDSTSGESTGEAMLGNDNRALWNIVNRKFNFKFNRKYKFEGISGGELVGWVPFVAVQLDRTIHGAAFTGAEGSQPSPHVTYESSLYFKDIN